MLVNPQERQVSERVNAYYCKTVLQMIELTNAAQKNSIYNIFCLTATNYFNVFMSTTVLLGLTSFEKNWGPVDFWGGAVSFQLYWPPGPLAPGA